ncbi:MAG: hypothetical protein LBJ47_10880, partial [Tannerella sp.]|nr:hypothetical protein [Tannerella sp.]
MHLRAKGKINWKNDLHLRAKGKINWKNDLHLRAKGKINGKNDLHLRAKGKTGWKCRISHPVFSCASPATTNYRQLPRLPALRGCNH